MEGPQKIAATIGVLAIVIIAAVVAMSEGTSNTPVATNATPSQSTPEANTPTVPATSDASYEDGSYTAVGKYQSPGGTESVELSVSITNNLITATSLVPSENNATSSFYQNQFADNYKTEVEGKNINEIRLDKVAGSSLTPQGFNDALTTIKSQAKI